MIVAFTGHRPEGLGNDSGGAWLAIRDFLTESKPATVISGMAQGVDSFAFDIATELGIPIIAAVPWTGHGANWPPQQREQYLKRLEKASKIEVTSDVTTYNVSVYHKRNRWMIDHCDLLVGIWNGIEEGGTYDALEYATLIKRETKLLKWRTK